MDGRKTPADEGVRQVPVQRPSLAGQAHAHRGLVTFLFADIRGFTAFTGRHGAEAAARHVDSFVDLVSRAVVPRGGAVRGTWGDQVLAEFDSPRDAVRAAVAIQAGCVDRSLASPADLLPVGIGLDVGEPADEGDNQSAAALNVAARLCARAAPGEVLASAELVHLAGAVDAVSYVARGAVKLKGVDAPTRMVQVRDDALDRDRAKLFQAALAGDAGRRGGSRARIAALTVVAVAVVGVSVGVVALRSGDGRPLELPAGGVVGVDGGRVVDAVSVGGAPEGMSAGAGALWAAQSGSDSVARIDPESGRVVETVSVGKVPVAVVATARDVWVANSREATVSRISTVTNRVIQTVVVGNQPSAIAVGFGSVWVANSNDASLTRIDARSGRVIGTAQVGRGPGGVAVGRDTVWVSNARDGTVSPVDPRTNEAGAPVLVGAGPKGIATAPGGVWVANRLDLTVTHIDGASRRVLGTITVGDSPFSVVAARDAVWVSASAGGTLVEIDPTSQTVKRTLALGASPYGLAQAGDRLWAATRPFASAGHFGGTLRIISDSLTDSLDPALSIDTATMTLIHDGLVAFRRAAGSDNYDPVPNLSVALPRPTDGGRAYTFRLRPGIRYSDGRRVVPADVRRGVEREFSATWHPDGSLGGGSPKAYTGIVGAAACLDNPPPCDLSAGIRVTGSTVTFRLTRPDPDFLFKLAMHYVSPVPPGTPTSHSPAGVLGTGPYAVAQFTPGRSLRLERNPYFRSWSAAARPRGYPDAIVWNVVPAERQVQDVLEGRADHANLFFVPRADADGAALRRPAQVHTEVITATFFLILDTAHPPFDDAAVRRALSFALDRAAFADVFRGSVSTATCGLLPAGLPGYEPYCPYTVRPDDSGEWHGPDVPRAHRILARSRTAGGRVDISWPDLSPPFVEAGRYTAGLLTRLGFDARLHSASDGLGDMPESAELSFLGWYADYPSPSVYFSPLLSCAARDAENLSDYCNHRLDALADKAVEVTESDPGQAHRLWQQVYRTVTDESAVVPIMRGVHRYVVSERLGNYQDGAFVGPLFDQMWVR